MTPLLTFHDIIPLTLYIHLPWCVRKCPYCDFNSHEIGRNTPREEDYVDALIRDLEGELSRIWGRRITSIFIGGGTPSLFSDAAINRLLLEVQARLNYYPGIEITLEANPGTAEAEKFREFRQAGVNRLSLGVQSFDDAKLEQLGRIHSAEEARNAIRMAQDAGFEDINIDIMFGLPGQVVEEATRDLQHAVDHGPTHISWYQLTLEPNTVFYSRPPQLPDDDLVWEMQEQGQQLLSDNDYRQYEVSAWSKTGQRCVHNLNYWEFGDYLGIGAGAHSKITNIAEGSILRTARHRIPDSYMQRAGTEAVYAEKRELGNTDIPLEFMMNAMRLTEGVQPQLFLQRTGLPLNCVQSQLQAAEKNGLLEWSITRLKPTERGNRYLNDLLQLFMDDNNAED